MSPQRCRNICEEWKNWMSYVYKRLWPGVPSYVVEYKVRESKAITHTVHKSLVFSVYFY